MEEQGPSVAVSDDMLAEGLPVEIFTEFDVNMDNVVEIDTEGESTGMEGEEQGGCPDVIASETVVTTTIQRQHYDPSLHARRLVKPVTREEVLATQIAGTTLLTTSGRYDVHYEPLVALSPDSEEKLLVAGTNLKQEESDDETQDAKIDSQLLHKRVMDRLKKRRLRENPEFREKEKQEAKGRMRALRSDPTYRQKEREKDRLRRRLARQKNGDQKTKAKLKLKDDKNILKHGFGKSFLPVSADRQVMMDISDTKRDTDKQIIVTPVNQNGNVPKQQQQSKIVHLQQQHLVNDNSQLFQTVNMAKNNNLSATKSTVVTGNNYLSQTISVAKETNRLSQTVPITKDSNQMYETILVKKDGHLVLTRVPGNAGTISQDAFVTSSAKVPPAKKLVINIEPSHSKIVSSTKAI